jgi:hypothetical protein
MEIPTLFIRAISEICGCIPLVSACRAVLLRDRAAASSLSLATFGPLRRHKKFPAAATSVFDRNTQHAIRNTQQLAFSLLIPPS